MFAEAVNEIAVALFRELDKCATSNEADSEDIIYCDFMKNCRY